jgi:hypothetical protein
MSFVISLPLVLILNIQIFDVAGLNFSPGGPNILKHESMKNNFKNKGARKREKDSTNYRECLTHHFELLDVSFY